MKLPNSRYIFKGHVRQLFYLSVFASVYKFTGMVFDTFISSEIVMVYSERCILIAGFNEDVLFLLLHLVV